MKPARGAWYFVTGLVLALALATSIDRAARLDITHDEAITYNTWVSGSFAGIFDDYIANNHVLNTVLAWLSTRAFGASAFTLRLPALLGAFLAAAALLVLWRRLGGGACATLAVTLVATNPFILDWFACARGYALATAALLWAVVFAWRFVATGQRRDVLLFGAATACGLVANLAFLFGFAALATVTVIAILRDPCARGRGRAEALNLVVRGGLATVILAAPLLVPLLADARRGHYDFGSATLVEARTELVRVALFHGDDPARFSVMGRNGVDMLSALTPTLAEGLALLLFVAAAFALWRRRAPALVLCGGALACTVLLHAAANAAFDVAWPKTRTALPLLVFALLGLGALVAALPRALAALAGGGVIVIVAVGLRVLPADRFADWTYDARSAATFDFLRRHRIETGRDRLRVLCVPFQSRPALEFYRQLEGAEWLELDQAVERGEFDVKKLGGGHDVHVALVPRALVEENAAALGLRIAAEDVETGVILLVRTEN